MIEENQQHKCEAKHADNLSGDTNVVNDRYQPYSSDIDDRADNN